MIFSKDENKVIEIPTVQIRPNRTQPRKNFDEDELLSLSRSITNNGILQPLTVRKISQTEFELIAGERRLRASIMAGIYKVPCVIIKCTDKESAIFALLENLQRSNLNMFEQARGISRLIRKYDLTQQQVANQLGKKQSTVANKLRLLRFTTEEQDWIIEGGLSERHARALLKIENEELRKQILSKIVANNLNVSQSENLIVKALCQNTYKADKKGTTKIIIKDVRLFVNTINKAVDTMRSSGINAVSKKSETLDYIEYTVKIPKQSATK